MIVLIVGMFNKMMSEEKRFNHQVYLWEAFFFLWGSGCVGQE
jgi:hypothetical protein